MDEKVIDVCGKRITEYLIQALSWFNRGGKSVVLRGVGGNATMVSHIATILQNRFECEMVDSRVGYFMLKDTRTSYLEISLKWKYDRKHPMNYEYPQNGFVDFPIYHFSFDKMLTNGVLQIFSDKTLLGEIKEIRGRLHFQRKVDKKNKDEYYKIMNVLYRAGMLLPATWFEITEILSQYDDIILGLDTNILLNASLSEHLIPTLSIYNPINYAHTPNWILFVIPSTVMYELEEMANIRDEYGRILRFGRRGFRALQEIIELNESYDLPGISIVITGETDPVLETRAEIQGLRQDLRALAKGISRENYFGFSRKSSSGDIIIRDQFKNFLRKIDFHKGVYFLTSDKSNAALADAEGLHSLYMKLPNEEYEKPKDGRFGEIEMEGKPSIIMRVPVGKLLYELAVEFGEILVSQDERNIKLSVDLKGEKIDRWLNRMLSINKYEYRYLQYSDGYVDINHVIELWREIMRVRE